VTVEPAAATEQKPRLVFFHSRASGRCRRVEGFLAQVLQRRRNHETFRVYNVAQEERPDLLERFGIAELPTIVVVEGNAVRSRVVDPKGTRDIEDGLEQWLR
jgi:thioredoxin-like negative regulator of GroEL